LTQERLTVHVSDDMGRIAMVETETTPTPATRIRYIYSNHLQSATLELDDSCAIISYEEYHPFGTTAFQSSDAAINAVAKRYRYTGKERDEETGLYYHGARYYIPWLARWSASDPMENKYAGMSPYNYSMNNPVMLNDPSGADPQQQQAAGSDSAQSNSNVIGSGDGWRANGDGTFMISLSSSGGNKSGGGNKNGGNGGGGNSGSSGNRKPHSNTGDDNNYVLLKTVEIHQKSKPTLELTSGQIYLLKIIGAPLSGQNSIFGRGVSVTTSKPTISHKKSHNLMESISNMMSDPTTKSALENASKSTGVNMEDLMTMAMVESNGNAYVGTNKYGYTGLMQLGASAVKDIQQTHPGITYKGVKSNVEMNATAGALYWKQNEKSLNAYGIEINVLHQYLAHQQGAKGLSTLLHTLKTNPDEPIIKNQRTNLPPKFIKEHNGNVTQQDFYDYWKGRIGNIQFNVNTYLKSR
jgi:RHS repeat-associated protein